MEKVIGITGKGYVYSEGEPIKDTASHEENYFPDNEMGEDEEINFLKELLEQEERIQKECEASKNSIQAHRKSTAIMPCYDTSELSMQALERFSERVGEKEKELLAILVLYSVMEYEEEELGVILELLSRGEPEITDTLLSLSDCHPAKKRYLRYITAGGVLAQVIDAQAEKLFGRLSLFLEEELEPVFREIRASKTRRVRRESKCMSID